MRIIAFRRLREFYIKSEYSDSETALRAWYHDAKAAEWQNANELKEQYKNASIVGDGRIVFNIKGNAYRLVIAIDYEFQVVFIRFIGTHKQYDKIDAKQIYLWRLDQLRQRMIIIQQSKGLKNYGELKKIAQREMS